ncbi:MAG: outer membrane beta-barrel protein [Pedobacter sp.]
MKKQFLTAAAVFLSVYSYSQTKGTSALNFGVSSFTSESKNVSPNSNQSYENKGANFDLGYGLFVTDNNKVGIELLYNKSTTEYQGFESSRKEKGVGIGLNFQHYFPLLKTFYAYAGAYGQYVQTDGEERFEGGQIRDIDGYTASLSAVGGLTWFISRRWALETNLISAGAAYSETKDDQSGTNDYSNKRTNFGLSSDGLINNLGFRVYLMF